MAESGDTLQTLLNKATSPIHHNDEVEDVVDLFCEKVKSEFEGAITSTRLLAHKIQSPQEYEALQALVLLEACVKKCGEDFHHEIGKYRFLNELIKVVSPKYLGQSTTTKVKAKVIQLLYVWSIGIKSEVKIRDAYQMLKKQGIVKADPDYDDTMLVPSPEPTPPAREDTLFTDEDKKKQLERLLKSTNPADLQAANRLIKNVVKEDQEKMQKVEKRNRTLEEVSNNVRVFNEMIANFDPDKTTPDELTMMSELHDSCQKLRPTLFRLASDTEDAEQALMNILRSNDDLSRVMQSYEKIVLGNTKAIRSAEDKTKLENGTDAIAEADSSAVIKDRSTLLDLADVNLHSNRTTDLFNSTNHTNQTQDAEDLFGISTPFTQPSDDLSEFFSAPVASHAPLAAAPLSIPTVPMTTTLSLFPQQVNTLPKIEPPPSKETQQNKHMDDIDKLSRDLLEKTLGRRPVEKFSNTKPTKPTLKELSSQTAKNETSTTSQITTTNQPAALDLLADLTQLQSTTQSSKSNDLDLLTSNTPYGDILMSSDSTVTTAPIQLTPNTTNTAPLIMSSASENRKPASLTDIHVAVESIRPSTLAPLTVYDHNGLRVLFHFAKDHATPNRKDTLVAVASIMSTRPKPVPHLVLQVAVPKLMHVKLQPPSGTQLSAYNPIIPSPPITQVLILANPNKKEVKMRYKLDYKFDEQTSFSETGEITGFPPTEQWGSL